MVLRFLIVRRLMNDTGFPPRRVRPHRVCPHEIHPKLSISSSLVTFNRLKNENVWFSFIVPFPPVRCCLSCRSCHCAFTTSLPGRRRVDRGLPILMITLDSPKIPRQRILLLSDPGVPRTFVEANVSGHAAFSYVISSKQMVSIILNNLCYFKATSLRQFLRSFQYYRFLSKRLLWLHRKRSC